MLHTELVILITTAHPCLQLPRRKDSRLPYLHPDAEAAACILELLVAETGPWLATSARFETNTFTALSVPHDHDPLVVQSTASQLGVKRF